MPTRRQYAQKKGSSSSSRKTSVPPLENPQVREGQGRNSKALKADLEGVLDEIDDLLAVNAEEFVKGYVQKGGE